MFAEEKLQMHESNQVIDEQNDEPPSSPWTQFVMGSYTVQEGTHELVPRTRTMDY